MGSRGGRRHAVSESHGPTDDKPKDSAAGPRERADRESLRLAPLVS